MRIDIILWYIHLLGKQMMKNIQILNFSFPDCFYVEVKWKEPTTYPRKYGQRGRHTNRTVHLVFSLSCRLFLPIDPTSDRTASHTTGHSCVQIKKYTSICPKPWWQAPAVLLRKIWLVYLYLPDMPQCSLRFLPVFTETPQLPTW